MLLIIYLADGSLDEAIQSGELEKNATCLVYCYVDSVSISGAKKLIDTGFKNVYRLESNYKAWTDAGYEGREINFLNRPTGRFFML